MRNRKFIYVLIGVAVGLLLSLVIRGYANGEAYRCQSEAIRVESGDTYWGYLEKYCEGNIENAASDVVKFYGPTLMPGQFIYLPSSDKCDLSLTVAEDGNEYVYEACEK